MSSRNTNGKIRVMAIVRRRRDLAPDSAVRSARGRSTDGRKVFAHETTGDYAEIGRNTTRLSRRTNRYERRRRAIRARVSMTCRSEDSEHHWRARTLGRRYALYKRARAGETRWDPVTAAAAAAAVVFYGPRPALRSVQTFYTVITVRRRRWQ